MPTALLVEDQFPILEHAEYTVLAAASAVSAICICQAYNGAFDVLISEVLMSPVPAHVGGPRESRN